MGRSRRKYGKPTLGGTKPVSNVKVDEKISELTGGSAQGSCTNMLILPSKKEKTKGLQKKTEPRVKKLSKKQRKNLQRVLDQKEKKSKRAELLEQLSKVQAASSELALMSSIAHLGTKNSSLQLSKRPLPEELRKEFEKLNSIRGSKRKKKGEKKIKEPTEDVEESEDTDDINSSGEEDNKPAVDEINSGKDNVKNAEEMEASHVSESALETKEKLASVPKSLPVLPSVYTAVNRQPSVQAARLKLPILAEEHSIMEAVRHNQVVILCGETGSGKTTQVPQFLYEAGYANDGVIGITEPRRVAAISMSQRVAMEMNLPESKVSYQIRYEGNVTPSTEVKFMTDGVLLREVQKDFLLSKYSAIIVDEAHERSVYTDVLIGLLSRIVPLRNKREKPLRLIIMSATLRVEDFTENTRLFKKTPPIVQVETRQFPVTVHFSRNTPVDDSAGGRAYIRAAYKKICKVHRTLPAGGILVFVTGQNEVHSLCRMLRNTFPNKIKNNEEQKRKLGNKCAQNTTDTKAGELPDSNKQSKLPAVDLKNYPVLPKKEEDEVTDEQDEKDAPGGYSDDEDLFSDEDVISEESTQEIDQSMPMHILPLYSLLAPSKQKNVFKAPPPDCRLCIVATNVAETSLTIPGIKYVIDTGKVKKRIYDKVTGISTFKVTWVSKASADQRAGRAGRVGPGHAYRLYSSAVFQEFEQFSIPEIAFKPVPGLILQMKQLNIERVVNFPFPTPPPDESLKSAEELLISLGAVEAPKARRMQEVKKAQFGGRITELGRSMAAFPVHPRFGKMLATASARDHKDLLPYIIAIVAALTVRDIFTESQDLGIADDEKHRQFSARLTHLKTVWGGDSNKSARALGDLMVLLGAVGSAEYSGLTPQFCNSNCLRYKALLEVRKLRSQLTTVVNSIDSNSQLYLDAKMEPPSDLQMKLLRQIVLSAMGDQVARKIPEDKIKSSDDPTQVRRLIGAYNCLLTAEPVFIHPSSIMARNSNLPEYVVFQEIIETKKSYMKGVFSVEVDWLPTLCPQHCNFSSPFDEPPPFLNKDTGLACCYVNATYGRLSWPLGCVQINHPPGLDRYKWFARFMLEEYITRRLPRQFRLLLSRPEIMTKTWSNLQPRTQTLLQALLRGEVDSKEKLVTAWKNDPTYLLSEFREWLLQAIRFDVDSHWPPKL